MHWSPELLWPGLARRIRYVGLIIWSIAVGSPIPLEVASCEVNYSYALVSISISKVDFTICGVYCYLSDSSI